MMTEAFDNWYAVISAVWRLITSNAVTIIFVGVFVISILVSVVSSLFNSDGSRKDNG